MTARFPFDPHRRREKASVRAPRMLPSVALVAFVVAAPATASAQAPALGLEVELQGAKVVRASGARLTSQHDLSYGVVVARNETVSRKAKGFHEGHGTYERTIQLTLDGCTYDPEEKKREVKPLADVCDMEVVTGPAEPVHWDDMRSALKCWHLIAASDWSSETSVTIVDRSATPIPGRFVPLARFLGRYNTCVNAALSERAATWVMTEEVTEGFYFSVGELGLATHANFGVPLETIAKRAFLPAFAHTQGVPAQYADDVKKVVALWPRAQGAAKALLATTEERFKSIRGASAWKKAALQGLFTYWFVSLGMDFYWKDVHVNMMRQRPHTVALGVHQILPEFYDVFDKMEGDAYATYQAHFPERVEEIQKTSQSESSDRPSNDVAREQIQQSWLWIMSGQNTSVPNKLVHTGKPMDRVVEFYSGVFARGWPGVVFENRLGDIHLGFTPLDSTDTLYRNMKALLLSLGAKESLTP
jgi:hypothetical protein